MHLESVEKAESCNGPKCCGRCRGLPRRVSNALIVLRPRRVSNALAVLGFLLLNAINVYALLFYSPDRFTIKREVFFSNGSTSATFTLTFDCLRATDTCTFCTYGESFPEVIANQICTDLNFVNSFCPVWSQEQTTIFQDFPNRNTQAIVFYCAQELPTESEVQEDASLLHFLSELPIFLLLEVPAVIFFGFISFAELYVDIYGSLESRREIGFLELAVDISWMMLIYQLRILQVECSRPSTLTPGGTSGYKAEVAFSLMVLLQFLLDPAIMFTELSYVVWKADNDLGFPREQIAETFKDSPRFRRVFRLSYVLLFPVWICTRLYSFTVMVLTWPLSRVLASPMHRFWNLESVSRLQIRLNLYGVIIIPTLIVLVATLNAYFLEECRTSRVDVSTATRLIEFGLPIAFLLLNPAVKVLVFREGQGDSERTKPDLES